VKNNRKTSHKEIFTQVRDTCPVCKHNIGVFFVPHSDEDKQNGKEFKLHQIVRNKIFGTKKARSLKQLGLYFSACNFLAFNTDHKQWNTKDKVDFQCRVETHFVNPDLISVKRDGSVQFSYRSIAFKNLEHIKACGYFDQAFGVMTDFWNATHTEKIIVDEFIAMVKKNMEN
jgi:hypothetical protein